ncbi:MAG: clostripain-related cysteine peptidase, partial [Planctomycetota bacterium]
MRGPRTGTSGRGRGAALVALLFLFASAVAEGGESALAYDWGVAYWMPYDNDLEQGREPIIKAIRKGMTGKNVAVAVQGDFSDVLGMHRMTVTAGGVKDELVGSDDSADASQLIAYLEWFATTFRCRKYVVVIMNHGGGVDEMCLDDMPETPGKNWMSGKKLGARLRRLKARMPGSWDLLFLQQCGRASLENLYSFRGTAKFVMASPMKIGAPNTYYTEFHKFLAANPNAAGDRLAELIGTK